MMMQQTPGTPQMPMPVDRSLAKWVALLMAVGLIGLIAIGMLAGKKHLQF